MQQNIGNFLCKTFARKIHHFFFSFTLVLLFSVAPAWSAGYSCPTYKKYTSCNAGYYMTDSSGTYNGTPAVGNACTICPAGSYCTGGTANKTTCTAGKACTTTGLSAPDAICKAGYYCPAGSTSATAYDCDTGTTTASTNNYWTSAAGATARTKCYRSVTLSKNGGYGTVSLTNPVTGSTVSATSSTSVTTQCYYSTSCTFPTITDQTGGTSHGVTNGLYSGYYTYCGGWSTSSTVQTACPSTASTSFYVTSTAASVTYYAVRTGDDKTITLNNNSATSAGSTAVYTRYAVGVYLDAAHTTSMTTTTNPITLPTKTGYTFDGYASSTANCTSSTTRYISATGYRTSSLTTTTTLTNLYACWIANTYTVSFDANGGSGGQTADVTATYASAMPTISTTAPTKTACKFNGWYDATSGGTQYYTAAGASARTWDKTSNATLYAQWSCMTVSVSAPTLTYNGSAQSCAASFTVSGPSSYTVTYSSSSSGKYSATAPTLTNAGTTIVYYKVAATDYTAYSGRYTCTMNKASGTTTVSKTSMTITYPTPTGTFTASCSESGAASVSSSDTSKATVSISSGTATVTWKAAGSATITVNCAATTNYNASSKTVAVTIAKGTNTLTLSATSGTLSYTSSNKTKSFTVSTNTSGGALSAVSSATGVATVAVSGTTVTATYVKAGSATITVTSAATSYYNAATATYALTVNCGAGYYSNSSACTICGAGTYTSSANTASSCTNVNAGCYGGQGATSACPTECATGSYSAAGASACTPCQSGKTTSGTGKTSCDATCSNANGANAWATASWSANTVSNLCTISKCNANTYYTATTGTGYKNTCTSCGSNSSTAAGNTSTTCTCTAGYTSTGEVDGASTSTSGCSLISNIACAIGQYVPAKATSCSACTAGYYCPSSAKTYSYSTSIQGRTPCSAGTYQPDTGKTSCIDASAGYYVGDSAATEQLPCTGATYAANTKQTSCTTCPTVTNNASKATGYSYWNTSSNAGDHTTVTGCYVIYENEDLDDGSMSLYYCYADTDAETTGEYAVDGTSKGCWVYWDKLKCDGGYYNKNYSTSSNYDFTNKTIANLKANACIAVEAGYWSANDALTRTACDSGLTTIGYGTGANEAADCGRKLHAGDNVIYLRSESRTTPALNVKIGNQTFFGALSTSYSGALKVKNGSTTYSVVNDWQ